jgi:hypothetical protein
MAGFTNRGKHRINMAVFRGEALPASFNVALITSATAPTADTNLMSDLTEIPAGNGYTSGGINVTRDATGFPTVTEDDSADRGRAVVKDLVWTASGGNLPASGSGARYAVLTDNNGTVANREIWAYWSLAADRIVSDTQTLTVSAAELRLNES